ncbi:3',5'-cyclic-nucleotide phosphodiesterase [Angomonas deanei]|uniref:Phosphodiesterase n=1 Tax=Angomonas deanei TaxID=59799 RepID=A0A7G2CRD5_9TRYP|nr:3',5'-cyclic-nucleotide phosphodiesterase [Angomonas deanei]CAD2222310.1 3'5'-cyclic nucleotide phosphodiesterase, putative [Angomonas deanei]|eukprot:EPY29693.1 3',5'-cyclic-nucleotide phosphodiesterase [Angomonas deanei]
MSNYFDQLHKMPPVWCTSDDQICVMCAPSENMQDFGVYMYSYGDNTSYKKEYDMSALSTAKGSKPDWTMFFPMLSKCVSNNNVVLTKVPSEEKIKMNFTGPCGNTFGLEALVTTENMEEFIISRLMFTNQVFSHTKEIMAKDAQLEKEANTLKEQADGLDSELQALKDNIKRNEQQESISRKRLGELKKQWDTMETSVDDPWKVVKDRQTKECRRVNPLLDKKCKDFDKTLMQLIKSLYIPSDDARYKATDPCHSVVKPLSKAELAQKQKSLANDKFYGAILKNLEKIEEWAYSVSDIQCIMNGDDYASLPFQPKGGSLFVTLYALFFKLDLLRKFKIDEQLALNWISVVEAGYHGNPYHNSMHAADVLHIVSFILTKGGLIEKCQLKDEQVFSAVLAASIHDFEHPGINNNFHMKTSSYLATLYNDRSVLENLHVSSVFELMKNSEYNILSPLSDDQRRDVRELVIEMVLATDMGSHGKYVTMMKSKLQEHSDFLKKEDQFLALAMALKMADISNCGRPLDIYLKWSGKVSDEFYQQGDRERNLGLPCSPFMDRLQPSIAKGQISFMNYIIIPFFEQMSELLPALRFAVDLAEGNKAYWAQNDDS